MSGIKLTFDGIEEFKTALRNLPKEMADEAHDVVRTHATIASKKISQAYPQGKTGTLRGGLLVRQIPGKLFTVVYQVASTAKQSSWLEYGVKKLRKTKQGYNRGALPREPEQERMIPIVQRQRISMVKDLIALVARAGFEVKTS